MSAQDILKTLESLGSESYRAILRKHGANDPVFGVKIEEMKKLLKAHKGNTALACDLFATGNYDAQYLAGLMANGKEMSKEQLQQWLATANCNAIRRYSVAWVATESSHVVELINEWGSSSQEDVAATAWATLISYVSVTPDQALDLPWLQRLLDFVQTTIHQQPNEVRSGMNSFVIALGSFVAPLHDAAVQAGKAIGTVSIDVGDTACKIPFAPDYIAKVAARGAIGKKRKEIKC
ncbi:DNA alkylation repair protein [Undibacterium cyanobacteriorum]|uniref:DNA alkylation repair protein n=1 Tax=Undibacterium cyanobacteriorum TaxID=3073561 RepID=A0ABY9RHD7_9BURK|nr:DNA alkylation repair protein [Undibacterium sp. 20NA77.5]WMW80643.1 DNA alkylation repair protein [Undibacterium sp. 20NA77.5]